jgi:hypothetical protein
VSSSIYATLAVNTANSRKESTERAVLNTLYIFLDASDCSQATTVLLLPENFITSYQPMMSQGAAGIFWGMKALQYLYVRTWPGQRTRCSQRYRQLKGGNALQYVSFDIIVS